MVEVSRDDQEGLRVLGLQPCSDAVDLLAPLAVGAMYTHRAIT